MIVSFNFSLFPREELRRLPVHLMPIIDGLVEAGHRVERIAMGLKPAPVVNVLPYHPAQMSAIDELVRAKAAGGARLCAGLLWLDEAGPDGPVDTSLADTLDFIWSVRPLESARCMPLRYGFSSRGPKPQTELPRDIDVALRGEVTARRTAVFDQLNERGAACFWIDNPNLPLYVTDDILGRSKIVIDFRPDEGRPGGASALTAQALHHAAAVVSETGGPDDLARFTIPAPPEQLVERCIQILNSGMHAGLGAAARQKFQAETSMGENMAGLMKALAGPRAH